MSVDPSTAPFRTAFIRGIDGLYYKIGGGSDVPEVDEVHVGVTPPPAPFDGQMWVDTTGAGDTAGGGDDEVYVGSSPPPAPFNGQMWVDLTGSGSGTSTIDEVHVSATPPATPFDGQMWVDLTGAGSGATAVDEVHVGLAPPPTPFNGQMWVDLTGSGAPATVDIGGVLNAAASIPSSTTLNNPLTVVGTPKVWGGLTSSAASLVIPVAGFYRITASGAFNPPSGSGTVRSLCVYTAGVSIPPGYNIIGQYAPPATYTSGFGAALSATGVWWLAVGDTLTMFMRQDSGGALTGAATLSAQYIPGAVP